MQTLWRTVLCLAALLCLSPAVQAATGRRAAKAPADPELYAGEMEFDFPDGTKLDRSDQRDKLAFIPAAERVASPRSLEELHRQAQAGQRYVRAELNVSTSAGSFIVTETSPIQLEQFHDPLREIPILQNQTDLQVFTSDGVLTDEVGPFNQGYSLLALPVRSGEDWLCCSTLLDGAFLFDVQPGGKLRLVLRCSQRYFPSPAFDLRDIDGDGEGDLLLPAGEDWTLLTSDQDGPGYVTPHQLRRFNTDYDLRPAQRIRADSLHSGVFVIYLARLDPQAARPTPFYAMVNYWTPDHWQWAQTSQALLQQEMAGVKAAEQENARHVDLVDHGR